MIKEKKLYKVFKKVTQINDVYGEMVQHIPLGYAHAKSDKQAITFVKYNNGIKTKNHYTKDNYTTNCHVVYDIYAEEVKEKENETTISK